MKTRTLLSTVLSLPVVGVPVVVAQPEPAAVGVSRLSAAAWDANDANRPCTTVVAPDNDRAVVVQGTASREQATCVVNLANTSDARCRRVYHNRAAPTPLVPAAQAPARSVAACTDADLCSVAAVPEEDGSGSVFVFVGDRTVRCFLSNPTEEAARFTVPCRVRG